jgi:hypothetical protein
MLVDRQGFRDQPAIGGKKLDPRIGEFFERDDVPRLGQRSEYGGGGLLCAVGDDNIVGFADHAEVGQPFGGSPAMLGQPNPLAVIRDERCQSAALPDLVECPCDAALLVRQHHRAIEAQIQQIRLRPVGLGA